MRTRLLTLALLLGGALISCDNSTEPTPTPEPTIRAGSTFTFQRQFTDTSWTTVDSSRTVIDTVLSVDTTIAGVDHAYYIKTEDNPVIYTIESNGDVKLYQPEIPIAGTAIVFPEVWTTLPGVSKTDSIGYFTIDTLTKIQGQNARIEIMHESGYIGESKDTVNGKVLTLQTSYVVSVVRVTVLTTKVSTRLYVEYSYSPELKTIVVSRQKAWSNHDESPVPNGGDIRTLMNFTL